MLDGPGIEEKPSTPVLGKIVSSIEQIIASSIRFINERSQVFAKASRVIFAVGRHPKPCFLLYKYI